MTSMDDQRWHTPTPTAATVAAVLPSMPDDYLLTDLGDLALAVGGDNTSFTGDVLRLIPRAHAGNLVRLAVAFPELVHVYQVWHGIADHVPTAGELRAALAAAPAGGLTTSG